MSDYAEGLDNPHDSIDRLDKRDARALTERLTVLPDYGRARGAEGLFVVVSHTGEEYLVDVRLGACECPDMEYRDPEDGCKHVRRVRFVTGCESVPAWVDVRAIDPTIGCAVNGVAADGGECDDCAALDGEWPCADCYIQGDATLPEEGAEA